jgi:drug/metabolite transporter (DMT)-like permease
MADKGNQPVFPRWAAYFNFWTAMLYLPAFMVTFFKAGPFAWNGLLAFWLALLVAGIWTVVMFVLLLKAIRQQEAQAGAAIAIEDPSTRGSTRPHGTQVTT